MAEQQDKGMTLRLIIAVVVAIVAMLVINWIFDDDDGEAETAGEAVPEQTEQPPGAAPIEGGDAVVEEAPAEEGGGLANAAQSAGYGALVPDDEALIVVETERAVFRLSNLGGAYKSITLNEFEEYGGGVLTLFNKQPGEYYPGMVTVEGFPAWTTYRADHPAGTYQISGDEEFSVTYTATVGQVTISKRYTFRGDSYVGLFEVTASGVPTTARNLVIELGTGLDRQGEWTRTVRGLLSTIAEVDGDKFEESPGDNDDESVEWGKLNVVSINDNHFTLALAPDGEDVFYGRVALVASDTPPEIARTTLTAQASEGGLFRRRFVSYIGPKYYSALDELGMGEVADFGWNFLSPISIGLLKLLNLFFSFLGSYGLAIILMTLVVKTVLLPLTNRAFRSSIAMQMLQPRIEAIKERYANDQQRANEEIMALYKKNKVSPMGGCLPLLLQMPVFIALFGVLRNAVELRGAAFLWISDLTLPDALFSWGVEIPLIGATFNLLPLLMIGAMWYQGRMTAKRGGKQTGFTKFMPIIFGVLFYKMPAGLVLYWLTNTLLTILQQHFLLKSYQKKHGLPEKDEQTGPGKQKRLRPKSVEQPKPAKQKKAKSKDYEVACEKCGHKSNWDKCYRVVFKGVDLGDGETADVDGVYCSRCGAALAMAVDDDERYALVAGDPETPVPSIEDESWGRRLSKNLRDRSHYKKIRTK